MIASPTSGSDPFITSPPRPELSSTSPSLMSPTFAARIQTLTNYLPMPSLPWSPRASKTAQAAAAFCIIPESSSSFSSIASEDTANDHNQAYSSFVNSSVKTADLKTAPARTYVPKERQLEKLRLRLEEERRRRTSGGVAP